MKRTHRSALVGIVATLMLIAYSPGLMLAAPARAQAKPVAAAAGTACSLLSKEIAATALGEAVKGRGQDHARRHNVVL